MKSGYLVLAFMLSCLSACGETHTPEAKDKPNGAIPAGYTLTWADEFDNSPNGLPSSDWWFETGNHGWGNNEPQNYVDKVLGTDTVAKVQNGMLTITAFRLSEPYQGSDIISARMNTVQSWKYGYFEMRAKLPGGKGTWAAFWMLPKNFQNWPLDGEIDIMEYVGYRPDVAQASVHTETYNHKAGTEKTATHSAPNAENKFYTYGLLWTEDEISGYIDGVPYFTFKNDRQNDKRTWPFNEPFYLKLNLAIGGDWGGSQGIDPAIFPSRYEIDYVRVYQPKGNVTAYVTTNTRSQDFKKQTVDFSSGQSAAPSTITLNPATRYQTMDGFGAAVTGSSAYNLLKMAPADRTQFLKETFSPSEGMGYSYIRVAIGCSDFSLSEYTCWDNKDAGFGLTSEETDYVIPVLKEIRAINPNIKVLGSPWTCPRWMKVNNLTDLKAFESWTSGQLNPAYYQDYATYFVKWIQAFEGAGIPIYSVTPQNEPLNRGNSASLFMGWQEQRDFVKTALTPKLKAAGLDTKIYLFDHNYNYDNMGDQNDYPIKIYDAGVDDVAGAAYHNYGGNRAELLDIHDRYPDKELIFTETSIGTWNDGQNLEKRLMDDMQEVALGTINNWCKAVIVWNLMLDSNRGPNRDGGCQTCYGAVDINRANYKTIRRNSHYYIIGHLSSVVKPGATRIGTTGKAASGITYAAFENLDGTYALVLLNNTAEVQKISVSDGTHNFACDVPAKAVASYLWNK